MVLLHHTDPTGQVCRWQGCLASTDIPGRHVATVDIADMNANEAAVFRSILLPDDSYDENGVYWADLPLGKRLAFTNKVDSAEARSELGSIWRMFKADPLSPFGYYVRNMVIPGAGLLLEG